MRIIPNINTPYQPLSNFQTRSNNISYNRTLSCDKFEHSNQIAPTNSVSFKSNVSNGAFLKNLSGVHDPYSGIVLLNHKEMNQINIDIDKTRSSNEKIKYLGNYTTSMLPVEMSIYEMFSKELKYNKHQRLQDILNSKKDCALKNLIKEERNILNEINDYLPNLSEEKQRKISNVICKADTQIMLPHEDKDHFRKFKFINELIRISQEDKFEKIEEKMMMLPEEEQAPALERLYEAERQLENSAYNVNIHGKTPLERVLELQKEFIPETVGEPNEVEAVIDIAQKLPTSKNSTDAFIIEMCDKNDNAIAKRLLKDSLGTIEHIVPESKGGPNEAFNFMFVSKARNDERGNMPLKIFMKKYPDIPQHTQEYVNDIMRTAQNGKLRGYEWYPYVLKETLREEMGINVDLKDYRVSPQKAFKFFPERLKPLYPKFEKYYSNNE